MLLLTGDCCLVSPDGCLLLKCQLDPIQHAAGALLQSMQSGHRSHGGHLPCRPSEDGAERETVSTQYGFVEPSGQAARSVLANAGRKGPPPAYGSLSMSMSNLGAHPTAASANAMGKVRGFETAPHRNGNFPAGWQLLGLQQGIGLSVPQVCVLKQVTLSQSCIPDLPNLCTVALQAKCHLRSGTAVSTVSLRCCMPAG